MGRLQALHDQGALTPAVDVAGRHDRRYRGINKHELSARLLQGLTTRAAETTQESLTRRWSADRRYHQQGSSQAASAAGGDHRSPDLVEAKFANQSILAPRVPSKILTRSIASIRRIAPPGRTAQVSPYVKK